MKHTTDGAVEHKRGSNPGPSSVGAHSFTSSRATTAIDA